MQDIFDRISPSLLKDSDDFREGVMLFTYFCPSCSRSFDSENEGVLCKFCTSEVREIRRVVKKGRTKTYRYFCPTCEKNFVTTERFAVCSECRTDYIHAYTLDTLPRTDKLYIRTRKAIRNILAARKYGDRKLSGINFKISFSVKRNKEELPTS